MYSLVRLLFKQGFYDHLLDELPIVIAEVSKKINEATANIVKAKSDPYFNCLIGHYEKDKENNSRLLGFAYRFRCEVSAYVIGDAAKADFETAKNYLKEEDWESMQHLLFDYDHSQIRQEARDLIKSVLCSRMKSVSDYKSLAKAVLKHMHLRKINLNLEEMRLFSMIAMHKQVGIYDRNPNIAAVKILWSKIGKEAQFMKLFEEMPWKIIQAVALFDGAHQTANELYDLLTKSETFYS